MRVVLQRVSGASVEVDKKITGKIGCGLLLYSGIELGDSEKEVEFMAQKILNLRIFPDGENRMNLSVLELPEKEILSVSQFTLASYIKKGRRPDFTNALEPKEAKRLYNYLNSVLSMNAKVETGVFGAMMDVSSVNDGPVTFIIEKRFP